MKLSSDGEGFQTVTLVLSRSEAHRLIVALLSLVDPTKPANHVHVTADAGKKLFDSPPEITAFLEG